MREITDKRYIVLWYIQRRENEKLAGESAKAREAREFPPPSSNHGKSSHARAVLIRQNQHWHSGQASVFLCERPTGSRLANSLCLLPPFHHDSINSSFGTGFLPFCHSKQSSRGATQRTQPQAYLAISLSIWPRIGLCSLSVSFTGYHKVVSADIVGTFSLFLHLFLHFSPIQLVIIQRGGGEKQHSERKKPLAKAFVGHKKEEWRHCQIDGKCARLLCWSVRCWLAIRMPNTNYFRVTSNELLISSLLVGFPKPYFNLIYLT